MADLILVCRSGGGASRVGAAQVRAAAARLAPEGCAVHEPSLIEDGDVLCVVADAASPAALIRPRGERGPAEAAGGGVCLGAFFDDPGAWSATGPSRPDGTYALVRWDAYCVELLSDVCASRTLWYVQTKAAFLASTSQRALVALLGSLSLDRTALAWSLTSGSLGPEASWDARIRRVPPDARVVLDRDAWRLRVEATPAAFSPQPGDDAAHVTGLRAAIETTCCALAEAPGRWVLPLSGGGDSRALLSFLVRCGVRPRCITWTTRASLRNPLSDAAIARVLARRLGVDHDYLFVDDAEVDAQTALARFVAADEGRNDEIGAYADGLTMWCDLRTQGVDGIIRGDEPFGHRARAADLAQTRLRGGLVTADDYPGDHLVGSLGLPPQAWPRLLDPAPGEGLAAYDVRLDQTLYVPAVLAGLNGPKARYVGIVNPLLGRRVVDAVRNLPPGLMAGKRAFVRALRGVAPALPLARYSSTPSLQDLLGSEAFLEAVIGDLLSPDVARVIPEEAALRIVAAMAGSTSPRRSGGGAKALARRASVVVPTALAARVKPAWRGPDPLTAAHLGLRVALASRTVVLLTEDARSVPADGPFSR